MTTLLLYLLERSLRLSPTLPPLRPPTDLRIKAQNRPDFPAPGNAAPVAKGWQGAFVAALQRFWQAVPDKIRPIPPFTGQ